jgi:hypothetical protein
MAARALPANSEVEYANYKTFMKMCTQARESLGKAVKADETSLLFYFLYYIKYPNMNSYRS